MQMFTHFLLIET